MSKRHVLLTGNPGVGKTTLVKKLAEKLKSSENSQMVLQGFFTEEVRDRNGVRSGFDVISINDSTLRKPLASCNVPPAIKGPKVGKYTVMVPEFESVALKCLENVNCNVLIIDEIGKMEMFSKRFPSLVKEVFNRSDLHILATIPVKVSNGPLATLLDTLKKNPDCQLIEVTKNNRNELLQEVCSILQ